MVQVEFEIERFITEAVMLKAPFCTLKIVSFFFLRRAMYSPLPILNGAKPGSSISVISAEMMSKLLFM